MPAKDQTNPTSRRSRLRLYFASNPGQHRAKDVAAILGEPTQYVANELARMSRDQVLERVLVEVEGRKLPITYYRQPAVGADA